MPVVLRSGSYRFEFYASDNDEPPHIHVKKNGKHAKFWLDPVVFEFSGRFRPHEVTEARKLVEQNQELFLQLWNEFFNH
ncbi:MAG TPA: DUF4160 domain-containing protein [Tepidisphaeraceae bacterium]|jgi:hypothetical protein